MPQKYYTRQINSAVPITDVNRNTNIQTFLWIAMNEFWMSKFHSGHSKSEIHFWLSIVQSCLTCIILQATSVIRTYNAVSRNVGNFLCYREIHQAQAMYFRSCSMLVSSLVAEIFTEVSTCWNNRCTCEWIFQHLISQHAKDTEIPVATPCLSSLSKMNLLNTTRLLFPAWPQIALWQWFYISPSLVLSMTSCCFAFWIDCWPKCRPQPDVRGLSSDFCLSHKFKPNFTDRALVRH